MLPEQIDIVQLAVGFAVGLVVIAALIRTPGFWQVSLAIAAAWLLHTLYIEGVPGLLDRAAEGVRYFGKYDGFTHGLLAGKLLAAIGGFLHSRTR